uniref:Uncharacterized protein n=1 Tax=Strongyloides stercoralis TaxID=6248 RepID=A0A0K0E517_STRER
MISIFIFFILINVFGVSFNSNNKRGSRDVLLRIQKRINEESRILHKRPDYSIPRKGPGEDGKAVELTEEEQKLGQEELKVWFMNMQAK